MSLDFRFGAFAVQNHNGIRTFAVDSGFADHGEMSGGRCTTTYPSVGSSHAKMVPPIRCGSPFQFADRLGLFALFVFASRAVDPRIIRERVREREAKIAAKENKVRREIGREKS